MDPTDQPAVPATPDYDVYAPAPSITAARSNGNVVTVQWSDGSESRYHAFWLRENEPGPGTFNPQTRELAVTPLSLPDEPRVLNTWVADDGALLVRFAPDDMTGRFHPGWLRAHDYSNGRRTDEATVAPVLWSAEDLSRPPTFDGRAIQEDDVIRTAFLKAVASRGLARLRGTPCDPAFIGDFSAKIGPVRDTNFGKLWDVRVEPDPTSNAYSALELHPHADLCTREYQPGLQILHCIRNSTTGGDATMVDGFRVAEDIRTVNPDLFDNLTTVERTYTNRARDTDYRWRSPPLVLYPDGRMKEVRVAAFLRGPTDLPFDMMETAWRADRELYRRISDPKYLLKFRYEPGDLVMFDNRRILHGRKAFDQSTGERWLRGCYIEREELHSALRIAARRERAADTR